MIKQLVFILFLLLFWSARSQDAVDDLFKVSYDTPLTIDLNEEDAEAPVEPVAKKKKRRKPRIYYGLKTKKGFTRTGFGKDVVIELFHYLKDYQGPDPYVQDFYWYDFKKKKIVNTLKVDPKRAGVLHGPYVKKLGDQILEEGFFYKGMKHKRWVRFNRYDILQDKVNYWKGWPVESKLSFYDADRTILREVIPIHFGEPEGEYIAFHSNGKVAARGMFMHGQRIGIWREFYPNQRPKRELYYANEPFNKDFEPYISKEWNRSGQLIYDHKKFISGR